MTKASVDRPTGPPVKAGAAQRPQRQSLAGRFVTLEPLDVGRHGPSLWRHVRGADHVWDYLFTGPYPDEAAFTAYLTEKSVSEDPLFWAIVDKSSGDAVGHATLMRIDVPQRVIETGSILYTPALQQTAGATECMYLLARLVFDDLGYRRYEWKCNALNAPSRRAAERLGFTFEGVFRQHMIVKGRNRDTAWYSMLDTEWPGIKAAFEAWLKPENFDAAGRQHRSLASLRSQKEQAGE